SGSDLIESRKTHPIGKRMITHARIRTRCFATGASRLRRRAGRVSGLWIATDLRRSVSVRIATVLVPRAEQVEEVEDDPEHRQRPDQADRRGIALVPVADLEGVVPHVDGPGVRRSITVEAAEDDVLVDERERRAEAEHDEDEEDRPQPREGDPPEDPPLAGAVDPRRLVELLRDRRETREVEHRVEAEAPPPFH